MLSDIIFINRNGLRWCDASKEYGPHKALYSRWKRWSGKGIFASMTVGLAANQGEKKTAMIDTTARIQKANPLLQFFKVVFIFAF